MNTLAGFGLCAATARGDTRVSGMLKTFTHALAHTRAHTACSLARLIKSFVVPHNAG